MFPVSLIWLMFWGIWYDSCPNLSLRAVRFKENPDGAPVFSASDVILLTDGGRGGHPLFSWCFYILDLKINLQHWHPSRKQISADNSEERAGCCPKDGETVDHCLRWSIAIGKVGNGVWSTPNFNNHTHTHQKRTMVPHFIILVSISVHHCLRRDKRHAHSIKQSENAYVLMHPNGVRMLRKNRLLFQMMVLMFSMFLFALIPKSHQVTIQHLNVYSGCISMERTGAMSYMVWKCPAMTLQIFGSSLSKKSGNSTGSTGFLLVPRALKVEKMKAGWNTTNLCHHITDHHCFC